MDIPNSKKKLTDKKGVSPIISTIIIVAIVIPISIALTLYLTGITGAFTSFEQLDVTSAYADVYNSTHYVSSMTIKNSGTSAISIDSVHVNGKPQNFNASWTPNSPSRGTTPAGWYYIDGSIATNKIITISQGDSGTIVLYLSKSSYKSGQSLEIAFHTMGGIENPKLVVLPLI